MSKRSIYRCENEYGDNACQWAKEDREIPDTELAPAIEGAPKCPECGSELVFLYEQGGGSPQWKLAAGIALGVLLVVGGAWTAWTVFSGGGDPRMEVETTALVFPRSEGGEASASLRIQNTGEGKLIIERMETEPSLFSIEEEEVRVEPGQGTTLIIRFKSPSDEMTEGQLLLYGNDNESPTVVRLTANQDPWWVYRKLEKSSTILSTES